MATSLRQPPGPTAAPLGPATAPRGRLSRRLLRRALDLVLVWHGRSRRRRRLRALAELDDRTLADIGVSRAAVGPPPGWIRRRGPVR